jgi:hypothetical protein
MKLQHNFKSMCVDWSLLLAKPELKSFLHAAHAQGLTPEAQAIVEPYKDYDHNDPKSASPMYFGLAVELLCEAYLRYFGRNYNLQSVEMCDRAGVVNEDLGTDGMAKTVKEKRLSDNRRVQSGSDIFIQVKGTLNPTKIYTANDGARLPNFGMNAMSAAITRDQAYQARYIVFTTGGGLHYTFEKMCHGLIELIAYRDINKMTKDNYDFWNEWREAVGLEPLAIPTPPADEDAAFNRSQTAA